MKTLLLASLLSTFALQAQDNPDTSEPHHTFMHKKEPPPPPYDADLFRKTVPVYSFHGEFLFWRVQEACLDYALVQQQTSWGPTLNYAQGSMRNQTFSGEPGFRLAFSYFRAPNLWEMKIAYTRLTARGSAHVNKPSSPTVYLNGTWPQVMAYLTSAKSHIHMNYNVADWLIDRFFNPNPHLRLRLYGGGSVAWINQSWTIQYADATPNTTTTQNNWSFAGGGVKAGFMVDWYWGMYRYLYMTVLAMGGGFLGEYDNRSMGKTTYSVAGSDTSVPFRNSHYHDVRPAMTFQFQIGPSVQKSYTNARIEFFAGYELNCWLNLHEIYRSSFGAPEATKETYINNSMIAIQGLTFRSTVDF